MNTVPISIARLQGCLFLASFACALLAPAEPVTPEGMQVFVENGGWCWFQDPRAVITQGKLVVGAVSVHPTGVVKAAVFDLDSRTPLGTAVLKDNFQPDDHNAPAFYLRPDGRLLAVYAAHGTEAHHYYRISEPGDFLRWGPELTMLHRGARVTYMNLCCLSEENRLYCFYRRTESEGDKRGLFNPCFMTSSDHGSTWDEGRLLIDDGVDGVQRPYVKYWGDGNRVHMLFTEAHPRDYNNSIYYAAFRGGGFQRADGTLIKRLASAGPLKPQEADLVYRGDEGNVAWCSSIVTDALGRPHAAYSTRRSLADHRYHHAWWDGTQWRAREVAFAGTGLYEAEMDYTGLITLDPTDPWTMYLSADVDPGSGIPTGRHEIYSARLSPEDTGGTIAWRPLTRHSPERNLRPVCVAGEGRKVLLWLRGPWKTYTDYDCDVVGTVLE